MGRPGPTPLHKAHIFAELCAIQPYYYTAYSIKSQQISPWTEKILTFSQIIENYPLIFWQERVII